MSLPGGSEINPVGLPKASVRAWILLLKPPLLHPIACSFFPALCWWDGIFIVTFMWQHFKNPLPHTCFSPQPLKRVCATLKSPKRYGKSRYGIPERYRYNTASTNKLLSFAVTPTVLARPGKQILNLFPLIIS